MKIPLQKFVAFQINEYRWRRVPFTVHSDRIAAERRATPKFRHEVDSVMADVEPMVMTGQELLKWAEECNYLIEWKDRILIHQEEVEREAKKLMATSSDKIQLSLKGGGTCYVVDDPVLKGLRWVEAFLPFTEVTKLERGNANVRPPAMKHPFRAMERTILETPQFFHVFNRGIFYLCARAELDTKHDKLTVWPKRGRGEPWGIGDGGHTFDAICREVARAKELGGDITWREGYAHVTFVSWDEAVDLSVEKIVGARNTSLQVQSYTLEDYKGTFDCIKRACKEDGFDPGLIAFRENEAKPWHVTEVIQRLSCFRVKAWANKQPISMYTSKNRAVKAFMNAEEFPEFEALFPVIKSIITLPERISSWIALSGDVNVRRLETIPRPNSAIAKAFRRPEWSRPGTDFPLKFKIDAAALLPMASAFRELLVETKAGKYKWAADLKTAIEKCIPDMFEILLEQGKKAPVPSALGYDPAYWSGCQTVAVKYSRKVT